MTTAEITKTWVPPTWIALQHPQPLPCQRTDCDPHDAREHLDPRHERYDGPQALFQVLPLEVRDAARTLWKATGGAPEVVDMARHIEHLREQIAHVRVDADRRERAAMDRALDCAEHGKMIADTERQAHDFSESARKMDRARVALLPFPQMVRDTVDTFQRRLNAGRSDVPTVGELLEALDKAVTKVFAAHGRAVK